MGMYDGLQELPGPTAPPPAAPKAPPSMYDGLDVLSNEPQQRFARGAVESLQAGIQASAPGLAWRGRLPDLVLDPANSAWWERALTGIAQVGADLPIMAVGAALGGPAGGAAGGAVTGPAAPVGAAVGTVLGAGAGMFALPGFIRESLTQAYASGEIMTAADWWNAVRAVAATTGHEALIGAATFGAGSIAARTAGKAILPAIGEQITVKAGIRTIGAVDTAAQIGAMVTMPAALQGRLPDAIEFMDAAIVIGGLKGAHVMANRLTNIYRRTGRTPAQVVADVQADPKLAEELTKPAEGAPEGDIPTFRDQLTKQEELWTIQDRLGLLDRQVPETLTPTERAEADTLRAKVASLEAEGIKPEAPDVPRETSPPPGPRYAPDQLEAVKETAARRIAELTTKEGTAPLTDIERAERIGLVNALNNPEALAKRYGIEPAIRIPTAAEREASAQRVYDDVLRQAKEQDAAREGNGLEPLGDEHAQTVAALVRARIRTRADRLGVLPEDLYRERPLQLRDETQNEIAQVAAEAAAAPDVPRFVPPEVDLFGEPIQTSAPRHGVENVEPRMVPVKDLLLSKDVPQFKAAANEKGVVEPLTGSWDPTGVGPIQIWERLNGDLEVISGRHRLDKVQRENIPEIWAQVHKEAEGFTKDDASTLDAILNIRDGQGSIADYAQYFKTARITKEAADAAGLLGRAKGRTGFAIARDASSDTLQAHRAGLLSDDAALAISQTAPGSERLQALGIAMVNDGKSILYAANMMRSVDLMASERQAAGAQGDIFGFDDSAMIEAAAMAKKASSAQRKISEQISAISGASKRPELARKMGVDVQDPEGIQKKIAELKQEQYQWDNWPLYPELVAKLRGQELHQDERPKYELTAEGPALRTVRIQLLDPSAVEVNNGVAVHQHVLKDADGKRIGEVALGWKGNQVAELINIFADTQRAGSGEATIRAILQHNKPDGVLKILDIQPEARAFWERMGTEFIQEEGHINGTITKASYEKARSSLGIRPDANRDQAITGTADGAQGNEPGGGAGPPEGGTLYQGRRQPVDDFELKPETPAELKARDEEAVAAAKRKLAQEKAGVKSPVPTVDQADLFSTQRTLFQNKPAQERGDQHLGSYTIAENLITTFRNANKSTVVHELSHSWLEEMKADAARPDAPAQIKADWEIIRREFAIGAEGDISTASHEQFARTAERYYGEGKAPSVGLRAVFDRFKAWMLEIYANLQNIGTEINPEIRGMFDRMLATDQEIADARALDVPRPYVAEARREAAERIVPPPQEGRKIEPGFEAEKASMEPYADELPKGPGEAPDSSHVNYAYINRPMDVKLAMQRMAEIDQTNIQKQRGGTQGVKSWAEANAEQAKYVNDILGGSEDTLRLLSPRDPAGAGPDVKLGILKKLAVGVAKNSARLRDVVLEAGHDATVRQQLEYMGSIERARMIQAEFLGERAGVARALNALKDVTEGTGEISRMLDAIGYGEAAARELFQTARTPAEEQAYMRAKLDEILQNYRGRTVLDIAKLHKEIGTLKGTFKFSKEVTKATKWEMVVEGWKASLLSGPVTHTTNLFGTEGFHFLRPAVDVLAATIGMARGASPGMGESDRASMSEAVARLGGMISGVQEGVKVAVATFKLDDPTGKTEAYRTAIPGRAGELIRIPLRLMGAEDALVTTMYRRGELATLAIRQAFDEQMNPNTREFADRVSYLKDHPTPEMEAAADSAATRMTFNAPLGEKGVALQLFVQKWNLQWMIPFIRTPINITKEVARMSPLAPMVGEWRAAIAKGGVERDRAIAETLLGAGIMTLTMAMAFEGTISGAGSPDPGKNRGKVGVWQPYSRLIGDTWYEYARIQPVGTLVGMAADVATIWDHMNDEEKDKIPKLLAVAFSNAVTNQTFLQGITNVINAMSEPTRFLPRFANQMAGSMVPNIIAQPTAMADPVVREMNGMLEAIQARLPGARQELLPKRDWLGEPVQSKERTGVVMPIREQKVSEDKVRLEAARLDISMAQAPKKTHIGKGTGKLGDVPLTPEERNTFAKVGGEMAHKILDNIVNAPGYDQIPDLVKRKIFAKVIQSSHQVAAVAALPMDKRIAYIQSISEKVQTELAPEPAQ